MNNGLEAPGSAAATILGSKTGKMVILIGAIYTFIISLSLVTLYIASGVRMMVGGGIAYSILTTLIVVYRIPSKRMLIPALFVFIGVPIVVTLLFFMIIVFIVQPYNAVLPVVG